jgi:hypothetical protein
MKQRRIEIITAAKKDPLVLTRAADLSVAVPSPDGKMVALRYFVLGPSKEKGRDVIVVVNAQGDVVAKVIVQ